MTDRRSGKLREVVVAMARQERESSLAEKACAGRAPQGRST